MDKVLNFFKKNYKVILFIPGCILAVVLALVLLAKYTWVFTLIALIGVLCFLKAKRNQAIQREMILRKKALIEHQYNMARPVREHILSVLNELKSAMYVYERLDFMEIDYRFTVDNVSSTFYFIAASRLSDSAIAIEAANKKAKEINEMVFRKIKRSLYRRVYNFNCEDFVRTDVRIVQYDEYDTNYSVIVTVTILNEFLACYLPQ